MRIFCIFLFFGLITISCNKDSKIFETIDLSINSSGDNDIYCIRIYKDGLINIFHCDPLKRKYYFNLKLSDNQRDSVSELTKPIICSKNDTIYLCSSGYIRHGVYVLFITTKTDKYKFYVDYTCEKKGNIADIFKLIGYLHNIETKQEKLIFHDFHFESYLKFLFPPPPSNRDIYESEYFKREP